MLKVIPILLLTSLAGCHLSTEEMQKKRTFLKKDFPTNIEESYSRWQELKQRHGNNYSYETEFRSWAGFGNSTKIIVENGQVESRHFFEWKHDAPPSLTWSESYAELGKHNQGSAAQTFDQVYRQCTDQILTKSAQNFIISLSFDQLGLLKQCSYRPRNCADDCSQGINISSFEIQ